MRFILFAFCSLHFATATSAQDSNFDPLGEHLDRPKMIRVMVEFIGSSAESVGELWFRKVS